MALPTSPIPCPRPTGSKKDNFFPYQVIDHRMLFHCWWRNVGLLQGPYVCFEGPCVGQQCDLKYTGAATKKDGFLTGAVVGHGRVMSAYRRNRCDCLHPAHRLAENGLLHGSTGDDGGEDDLEHDASGKREVLLPSRGERLGSVCLVWAQSIRHVEDRQSEQSVTCGSLLALGTVPVHRRSTRESANQAAPGWLPRTPFPNPASKARNF